MGLAGPRNRRKISVDPNNTKWTRDETTFGQKILRSQGWEPGKFLGAQGTAHAQLHSVASLAPIKVNLKDDTLGLGAKIRQKQSDECTGLDVFKDLLGRLNGKTEETLGLERQVRSEIKTNLFIERRYGPMRFVRGGLLVGDQVKIEETVNNKSERAPTPIKEESTSEVSEVEFEKKEKREKRHKSKKRKASEADEVDNSESKREKKRSQKPTKSEEEPEVDNTEVEKSAKKKKDKKEKKSKRLEAALEDDSTQTAESEGKRKKSKKSKDAGPQDSLRDSSTEISGDATQEKARKKEKKKDKKRKQADSIDASVTTTTIVSSTTPQDSGSSTPNHTGTSTPRAVHARHLARSRNIASKRMAFKDMQALNQIFMIKPV